MFFKDFVNIKFWCDIIKFVRQLSNVFNKFIRVELHLLSFESANGGS